jgi:hypothetical protein
MADVFLSYAREDRLKAGMITAALKAGGWTVWWDRNISPGVGFEEVIERELMASRCVVVLWSQSAIRSSWVRNEAAAALERGVLVPVLIDPVRLPIAFRHVHTADLVTWNGNGADDEWQDVVERITGLTADVATAEPLAPDPRTHAASNRIEDSSRINGLGHDITASDSSVLAHSPAATRAWKRRAIAAPALAVALLAALVLVWSKSDVASSDMTQEIVIDSSSAMSAIFGEEKMTKLEAAVEALETIPLLKKDNVALRAFGGDCHQDNGSRKVVDFGTDRHNDIKIAARERLSPSGHPALVFGVVSAIADVASLKNARRVIVLTGGDLCPMEDLHEIKVRLDAARLDPGDLDIRFIGLGVSRANQAKLRALAKTVGGGAHFVDTMASLNTVLAWALSFDTANREVLKQVEEVVEIVLAPTGSLNDFGDQLNARNFDAAKTLLATAQTIFTNGTERFDVLGKTPASATFHQLYQLAATARFLHQSDLHIGQELLRYGEESGGRPERPATVDMWNAAIARWLENTRKFNLALKGIDQQIDAVRQETRRRL